VTAVNKGVTAVNVAVLEALSATNYFPADLNREQIETTPAGSKR